MHRRSTRKTRTEEHHNEQLARLMLPEILKNANQLFAEGNYHEAIEAYQKAIARHPRLAGAVNSTIAQAIAKLSRESRINFSANNQKGGGSKRTAAILLSGPNIEAAKTIIRHYRRTFKHTDIIICVPTHHLKSISDELSKNNLRAAWAGTNNSGHKAPSIQALEICLTRGYKMICNINTDACADFAHKKKNSLNHKLMTLFLDPIIGDITTIARIYSFFEKEQGIAEIGAAIGLIVKSSNKSGFDDERRECRKKGATEERMNRHAPLHEHITWMKPQVIHELLLCQKRAMNQGHIPNDIVDRYEQLPEGRIALAATQSIEKCAVARRYKNKANPIIELANTSKARDPKMISPGQEHPSAIKATKGERIKSNMPRHTESSHTNYLLITRLTLITATAKEFTCKDEQTANVQSDNERATAANSLEEAESLTGDYKRNRSRNHKRKEAKKANPLIAYGWEKISASWRRLSSINLQPWNRLLTSNEFEAKARLAPPSSRTWAFPVCQYTKRLDDNCRAVFEYVKADSSIKKVILTDGIQEKFGGVNTKVFSLRSRAGQNALMDAGVIFIKHMPSINLPYPIDASRHRIINLWHGIPFKRIGATSLDQQDQREELMQDNARCHAVIASSQLDKKAMLAAFEPVSEKQVWITGLPRNDWLLQEESRLPSFMKEELKLIDSITLGRRLVLLAPTFRRKEARPNLLISDSSKDYLYKLLEKHQIILVVREHMADKHKYYSQSLSHPNIKLLGSETISSAHSLFRRSSLLITDYSSCFFDYMITGKPMLSYAHDLNRYVYDERGSFYNLHEVFPGPICSNFDALLSAFENQIATDFKAESPKYGLMRNAFFKYIDNDNTRRVVDKVINTES